MTGLMLSLIPVNVLYVRACARGCLHFPTIPACERATSWPLRAFPKHDSYHVSPSLGGAGALSPEVSTGHASSPSSSSSSLLSLWIAPPRLSVVSAWHLVTERGRDSEEGQNAAEAVTWRANANIHFPTCATDLGTQGGASGGRSYSAYHGFK